MTESKKRAYNSESRLAKAEQNKKRLLVAAQNLFETKGFDQVTIEEIAAAADLSAPTVYSLFQSKLGILRVLMDESLPPEQFESLVQKAYEAKSPTEHLEITARIARQLYDAERIRIDLLRGVSVLDPNLKELELERENRRYQRLEKTIQTIVEADELAEELPPIKAKDILWTFTGRDLYRMLVIERGWSSDEYELWLFRLLTSTLLTS